MRDGPGERDWALWRAVTLMGRRLTGGLEQRLQAQAGISVPDFDILAALDDSDGGRLRAGSLGDLLGWEKSRTSHHVARMEARSLVGRITCAEDQRGTWVEIRDRGREALALAMPVFAAYVREGLIDVVPAEERDIVARASLRVLDAAPAGSCRAEIDRLAETLGVGSVAR